MDASLAKLRHELESMQKQDKDLYIQLLTLRETIQSLKVELKKEKEDCEEAFYNLEGSLTNEFSHIRRNESELEQRGEKVLKNKKAEEIHNNMTTTSGKHDRQDSGISVRVCDVEASAGLARDFNGITSKPVIIHHSKQDSGILIDEEAVNETKLLSRLVQSSSRTFSRTENCKQQAVENRWSQVDKQLGITAPYNKIHNNRSGLSKEFFVKIPRTTRDPSATSYQESKHSRTKSCPSTSMKQQNHKHSDYKIALSHSIRPTQRSASVVDLTKVDEAKESNFVPGCSKDQTKPSNLMTKCELNLDTADKESRHVRAVLVCASKVSVSNAANGRGNLVSQCSLDGRGQRYPRSTEVQASNRRFTVVDVRPNGVFHDSRSSTQFSNGEDTSSCSVFPLKHERHHTMPEEVAMRRRHSIHAWHASSKSWDGNMGRSPRMSTLPRSTSQVSLV